MRDMWENALEEYLQITEISNCNFLMIDSVTNSKNYKQKIAEILFEDVKVSFKFINSIKINKQVQSVLFMNSATLSLFSTGKTTGFVIESGHGLTTATPIFEVQKKNISKENN
jgi:actin-related protein